MSSKRQISCSKTNTFWQNLIKLRWQSLTRITKTIENIEKDKIREENNLLNYQYQTLEYYRQKEKILRLSIMIKRSYETRNTYFEIIETISTTLTQTTC